MSDDIKKYKKPHHSKKWLRAQEWNLPTNQYVSYGKARMINNYKENNTYYEQYREETKIQFEIFEKRYWNEFFIFIDRDTGEKVKSLEFAKPYIIDALWANSGVALKYDKKDDLWFVYRLTMFWLNPSYQIESCDGIIYSYPSDYTNTTSYFDKMNKFGMKYKDTPAVLSSPNAVPWAYGINSFAQRWVERWNAGDINVVNSVAIKGISSDNVSANAIEEIISANYSGLPFTVLKGNFNETTDLSLENKQTDIWGDIDSLWKYFCKMRGLRSNFDFKKERNLKDELGNSSTPFIVCEGERVRILQYLMDRVNDIYGTNFGVITIMDEYSRNQEINSTIPEIIKNEFTDEVPEKGEVNKIINDELPNTTKGGK